MQYQPIFSTQLHFGQDSGSSRRDSRMEVSVCKIQSAPTDFGMPQDTNYAIQANGVWLPMPNKRIALDKAQALAHMLVSWTFKTAKNGVE